MGKYAFLVVEDLDYEKTELELSGLDPERLGFMESKEKRTDLTQDICKEILGMLL